MNTKHAQELRDALARYAGAARRVGGATQQQARTARRGAARRLNTTEVREWAKPRALK